MAKILCLESSSTICSVALTDPESGTTSLSSEQSQSHAKELVPLIQKCLSQSGVAWDQLDAVAVSDGPGSFTGLRVGAATAKGICLAHGLPLIAVDTLLAMARNAHRQRSSGNHDPQQISLHMPMIDARRNEVYTKSFDANWTERHPLRTMELDPDFLLDLAGKDNAVLIASNCISKFPPLDARFVQVETHPSAAYLTDLARDAWGQNQFVDISSYTPSYLKPPNITTPKKPI